MGYTVELDGSTYRSLEFAARIAGVTVAQVVARLVAEAGAADPRKGAPEREGYAVDVYNDYEGHRTHARFDRRTHRIDVTSGPLSGISFKTPSGAAIAVVQHYKPGVNATRNGWFFWTLDDQSGCSLQSMRQ